MMKVERWIGFAKHGGLVFTVMFLGTIAPLQLSAHDIPSKVPEEVQQRKNPLAKDEAVIMVGRDLYKKLCLSCHGPSGKGDGPGALSLPHRPPDFTRTLKNQTDGELFWKISRGGGAMPAYEKTLTEREHWQVIHYLRTIEAIKGGER